MNSSRIRRRKEEAAKGVLHLLFSLAALYSLPALSSDVGNELYGEDYVGTVSPSPEMHATRILSSIHDMPEAVTHITAEDLLKWGVVDITDVFRYIPGFRISQKGHIAQISYHGTVVSNSYRMEILLNGQPVIVSDVNAFEFRMLPVNVDDIAKITAVRGGNGAAYGDNALLASINIETKDFRDRRAGFTTTFGENDTRIANLFFNTEGEQYSFSINASGDKGKGYDTVNNTNEEYPDDYRSKRFYSTLNIKPLDSLSLQVNAGIYDNHHDFPIEPRLTDATDQFNKGHFTTIDSTYLINDKHSLDFAIYHDTQEKEITFTGCTPQISYSPGAYELASINQDLAMAAMFFMPYEGVITDEEQGYIDQIEASAFAYGYPAYDDICGDFDDSQVSNRNAAELSYRMINKRSESVFGIAHQQVDAESLTYFQGEATSRTNRVFFENQHTLDNKLVTFNSGAMFQTSNVAKDDAFNYRLSANLHFNDQNTLRFTASRSERQPSLMSLKRIWAFTTTFEEPNIFGEIKDISGFVSKGNPDLGNEVLNSYSIGYILTGEKNHFDLKIFHDTLSDPITDTLIFLNDVTNGESYHLKGTEGTLRSDITDSLLLTLNYSYLDTDTEDSNEYGLYSRHQGSIAFDYSLSKQQTISLNYVGNSAIDGHTYDRYNLIFTDSRYLGSTLVTNRLALYHHIGGSD